MRCRKDEMEYPTVVLAARTRHNTLQLRHITTTATALMFSGLAPALLMAGIWHDARIVLLVFALTLTIALSHAVLLGLPLFLFFQSRGWVNVVSCVGMGCIVGALPAAILTYPMQLAPSQLSSDASAGGLWTVSVGLITAATWGAYIKPLIYFGLLGGLGGLVFWTVFIYSGAFCPNIALLEPNAVNDASIVTAVMPASQRDLLPQ